VRTARSAEGPGTKVYFAIKDVPDALVARLNDLRQSFAGAELKVCSTEEKRAAN
jgi:hypothetical protein